MGREKGQTDEVLAMSNESFVISKHCQMGGLRFFQCGVQVPGQSFLSRVMSFKADRRIRSSSDCSSLTPWLRDLPVSLHPAFGWIVDCADEYCRFLWFWSDAPWASGSIRPVHFRDDACSTWISKEPTYLPWELREGRVGGLSLDRQRVIHCHGGALPLEMSKDGRNSEQGRCHDWRIQRRGTRRGLC
jgi:hypothetical protein